MNAINNAIQRIGILVFPGVDELDFMAPYEILKKAKEIDNSIQPLLIGSTKKIIAANGLSFFTDTDYSALENCSALIIPGGQGIHKLKDDLKLKQIISILMNKNTPFYTICSGIFLLGYYQLIDNHTVAVHHLKRDLLLAICKCNIHIGFVQDRNITSIGGDLKQKQLKGIKIGFEILKNINPDLIFSVENRLEILMS